MKIIYLELTQEHVDEVIDGLENTKTDRCASAEERGEVQAVIDEIQSQVDNQTETTIKGFQHE